MQPITILRCKILRHLLTSKRMDAGDPGSPSQFQHPMYHHHRTLRHCVIHQLRVLENSTRCGIVGIVGIVCAFLELGASLAVINKRHFVASQGFAATGFQSLVKCC